MFRNFATEEFLNPSKNFITRMKTKILFGAALLFSTSIATAQVAKPMEDVNKVVDNTLDSLNKAKTARIPAGTSRKGTNPVLFLIGNSTMRNGTLGNGNNGQWGWGYFAQEFFDENKITVENQALGGMSSRTFYTRLWPDVRKGLRKGDWVIISIGHNDNGPYDSGRARASIPGIGNDTLNVTIKETGVKETVYTYGEYLRKYIRDCRAAGANPILMSLTPRDAYDEQGKIVRVAKTFGLWASQVAEQEGVPYIDLNERSAAKLDSYGPWKEKYHFYGDHIHTSRFGAMMNARSAAEGIAESDDPKLAPLQAMMQNVELPQVEVKREEGKPVVFITGDSTVKNEDKDPNGMWGWGSQAYTVFDKNLVTCVNCAKAGRSTRTFLNEGRWEKVYNSLRKGDYVLIQFGHNDIGPIDNKKQRGTIACTKDTSHVYRLADSGQYEAVYSFGWYLKKFIQDVREKGATPILLSLTPRNEWPGGKIERRNDTYGKWYREVAKETGVELVDVHNISADFLDEVGREKAKDYFNHDHTHTSLLGAQLNAKSVAKGLARNGSSLARCLLMTQPVVADLSGKATKDNAPFCFSAEVPDGNYKVTVTLGSKKKAGKTVVRAESRRLMVEETATRKGEFKTVEFVVNKRTPYVADGKNVSRHAREIGTRTWDDMLTLEFTGAAPVVKEVRIERDTTATTVFLCGNSTVVDQTGEPYASWGQMVTRWFNTDVAIANHAESGLATSSFIASNRLDQVVATMRKGDYVFCEFGHNDQKERKPGSGAWYNFAHNLKIFIDRVRAKGGNIIFVTPTQRRFFDDATHTKIQETHGDYPDAMREVARRENVPVIELHDMTRTFFETLGYEDSKRSLVHYPANSFPNQPQPLADNTHFNPYGAYEVAKMVVMGMKQIDLPIVKSLRPEWKDFSPSQPDNPDTFVWYQAQDIDTTKPYGN